MVIVSRIAGCLEKFLEKILESFLRCGSISTSFPYFQQHFQHSPRTLRQQSIPIKQSLSTPINVYRLPQTTTQRITMKTERMPILSTHRTFSQLSLSSFNHSLSIHRTNAKRNTTTSLHSQEQPIPFALRFDFFEFNFFNLNIRIGFFEQLHPDRRIPINTPDFLFAIVFNVAFVYYS